MKDSGVMKKVLATAALFLGVALVVTFAVRYHQDAVVPVSDGHIDDHVWVTYHSYELGMTFEYPSDLIKPAPDEALGNGGALALTPNATTTPSGNGAHMYVSVEPTDVTDAATYINKYLPNIDKGLLSTTTIAGSPALEALETAYNYTTVYVVHGGQVYIISINLPPAESVRIEKSITFMTPEPVMVPDGWYAHSKSYPGATNLLSSTILTTEKDLPERLASDAPYSDNEIDVSIEKSSLTPEAYVARQGLSADHAAAMGLYGHWGAYAGHKLFSIKLEIGQSIMLFGTNKVESFLSNNLDDEADFWKVITAYATDPAFK